MSDTIVKLINISKAFHGVQALNNVNMEIKKGSIHCLIGENGSGKSTLVKIISGVHKPDDGYFIINEKKYTEIDTIESIRNGVHVIYQDFSLFPNLEVAENIALNIELASNRKLVNRKNMLKLAKEALENIEVQIDLTERVENISVADKQLVAIARALLRDAKLIIMDEPTSALTKKEISTLFRVIKQLQQEGVTILFITHKLDEVFEISEYFTILRNGIVIKDGLVADFQKEKFVYYMTGRSISESVFQPKILSRRPIMEVEDLCLENAFQNINFKLYPGEIVGITGILGSGRTELALSLYGLYPYTKGEVKIEGKRVKIHSIQDAISNGIAYLPEDRLAEGLCLPQSILRNVEISNLQNHINKDDMVDYKSMEAEVLVWLDRLSIHTSSVENKVETLSGGNQQKIVFARSMVIKPKILILNGPTTGVDIGSRFDIHMELRKIAGLGIGIIVISDDIPEVYFNCNRIFIMRKGKIVNELTNTQTNETELLELMIKDI